MRPKFDFLAPQATPLTSSQGLGCWKLPATGGLILPHPFVHWAGTIQRQAGALRGLLSNFLGCFLKHLKALVHAIVVVK